MTHAAGPDGVAEVVGNYDDAPGTYVCTPATDNDCTSSIRSGGGIALAGGGGWKFVPDEGATVADPDTQYSYFGWWLRATGGRFFVGVFDGGEGGDAQDFVDLPQLQGTATYSGPAAGKFVIDPQIGRALAGEFTADAELEVDFGDDSALGTVTGTVDGFMANAMRWRGRSSSSRPQSAPTEPSRPAARVRRAPCGRSTISRGRPQDLRPWRGQFHDVDENKVPNVATGTFGATYGDFGPHDRGVRHHP